MSSSYARRGCIFFTVVTVGVVGRNSSQLSLCDYDRRRRRRQYRIRVDVAGGTIIPQFAHCECSHDDDDVSVLSVQLLGKMWKLRSYSDISIVMIVYICTSSVWPLLLCDHTFEPNRQVKVISIYVA